MNNYTIAFDSCYTERKISNDSRELQVDFGNHHNVNSRNFLIAAFQTQDRRGVPNKTHNIAVFDNAHVGKFFVEIGDYRYPRDGVTTNFEDNSYSDRFNVPKFFYKGYVGEELLQPYIFYTDMKTVYPIQVIDFKYQVDHITLKKIQLFEEYSEDPDNEKLSVILIRHRQTEMISDGINVIEVKVI